MFSSHWFTLSTYWKKVPEKGDENCAISKKPKSHSMNPLKKSPRERGRKPVAENKDYRLDVLLKKSPRERGRKHHGLYSQSGNWKRTLKKSPRERGRKRTNALMHPFVSKYWKKVPEKGDENKRLTVAISAEIHYWKKVPEKGDENDKALEIFIFDLYIEKKSPRKGTKTRHFLKVYFYHNLIEKKSPRKGTKTTRAIQGWYSSGYIEKKSPRKGTKTCFPW